MSTLRDWLRGGDLRSDGAADQVVQVVLDDLTLIPDIVEGLEDSVDVVRGRCADVLEKVARQHPDALRPHLDGLIRIAADDPLPMVRWHLAMLLGHLAGTETDHERIYHALLARLEDESVFTISWAIVSLCILVRCNPSYAQRSVTAIRRLTAHPSKAVKAKVRHALPLLTNPQIEFPSGWIKSLHLQELG